MWISNTDFWITFESDYNHNESLLTLDLRRTLAVARLIQDDQSDPIGLLTDSTLRFGLLKATSLVVLDVSYS